MSHVLRERLHRPQDVTPIATASSPLRLDALFAMHSPPDHTWSGAQVPRSGVLVDQLSHALALSLREVVCAHDGDLGALLLVGFAVLLARYADQDQINADVAITCARDRSAAAPRSVVHTSLTIAPGLADAPSVLTMLQHMREALYDAVDAHANATTTSPFRHADRIVRFSYMRVPGDQAQPDSVGQTDLHGDLHLEIVDSVRGVQATWRYDAARFAAATVSRMSGHFQTLLAGIAAAPARPANRLPLLTDVERHQVLVEWNATTTGYPIDCGVHELFEAQAARTPDAAALAFGSVGMTYRELNRRANHLARRLQRLGVGPDVLVGICMERSPAQIVSVLAILKAGGAFVPLDPGLPQERLALMLHDTQMPALVTQRHLAARLPAHQAHVVCVEDEADVGDADDVNCHSGATADNLAYVIYTSGSTGTPKGVMVERRGLTNHTCAMVECHSLDAGDRVLLFVSLSFDAAAAALFPPLVVGATLVLPEVASSVLMGDQLTRLCEQQRITVAQLPASVWHQWVDTLLMRDEPLRAPLKVLLVGGESPSADKLRDWVRVTRRPVTFLNAYGPTEASITATIYKIACDEAAVAPLTSIPIGRPLANMQIYLLDARMQPVPIGVPGEVYIGGVGLARGYLNRPELSAERFVLEVLDGDQWTGDDASRRASAIRLYKTGDRARYRSDGNIEFLERIDHQVKLRGFRIEPGEIEAVLRQHPAVRNAVVLAREDTPGLQRLVAYVVLDRQRWMRGGQADGGVPDPRIQCELSAFLGEKLPEYMVPSIFVPLQALPLTANGKVDRRALPAPDADDAPVEISVSPRTPEEVALADIWAKTLGRAHVGLDDDFFALGGHSLLAARAIARINAALNRDIPLRLIFEAPTVAAFARAICGGATAPAPVTPAPLAADVTLDPSIVPSATAPSLDTPPAAIFLTGATGFVGAFLLHELLANTQATVYCLVRAATAQDAGRRIRQTLAGYHIWRDDWHYRIIPVVGDLRKPQLGLDAQMFQYLARTVDAIYHAGAQVHYLHPYDVLKDANVQGTVEILRLACRERPKPVHYISSLAVGAMAGAGDCVREGDELADCTSDMGYIQSKWVAEGVLRLARARGLPISIYRPTRIGWHTMTAAANRDDFFLRLLAGCFVLGLAPDIPMVENLIPVDFATRAIVHLSQLPASANKTFHLQNLQPTRWPWVVGVAQEIGHPLRMVPYEEWFSALRRVATRDPDHRLHALLMLMPQNPSSAGWLDGWARQAFDGENTRAGLAGSGLHCPVVDTALLKRLLVDGARHGFFAAPRCDNNLLERKRS